VKRADELDLLDDVGCAALDTSSAVAGGLRSSVGRLIEYSRK
jgi:hypothetical protein